MRTVGFLIGAVSGGIPRHESGRGVHEYGAVVKVFREDALSFGAPGCDGTFIFGFFAEDESEEHVEAAEGEEEECSDQREVIDVV